MSCLGLLEGNSFREDNLGMFQYTNLVFIIFTSSSKICTKYDGVLWTLLSYKERRKQKGKRKNSALKRLFVCAQGSSLALSVKEMESSGREKVYCAYYLENINVMLLLYLA